LQRYFVAPEAMTDQTVIITGDDVKHITRVLRMQKGDIVICSDGNGRTAQVALTALSDREVRGDVVNWHETAAEAAVQITLIQGLPKGDKLDWIVQKGTELGVCAFWPTPMERSVTTYEGDKEARKTERWKRIAKEAAEQARRDRIPDILPPRLLRDCIAEDHPFDLLVVPYESERHVPIRQVLRERHVGNVGIVIGPEGGLTEREIAYLMQCGARVVTLGPRILRTETAGLVTAAAGLYEFGPFGG